MEMSNVNKFAIHNCNHLMLEQTGEWLSPKAMNCCTNTSTKAFHVQKHCSVFPSGTSSRLSPSLVFLTYVLVTASFPAEGHASGSTVQLLSPPPPRVNDATNTATCVPLTTSQPP